MKVLLFLVSLAFSIYGYMYIRVFYSTDYAPAEYSSYFYVGYTGGIIRNVDYTEKQERRLSIIVDGEIYSFLWFNIDRAVVPNDVRDTILNRFRAELCDTLFGELSFSESDLVLGKRGRRIQLMIKGNKFCEDCVPHKYEELGDIAICAIDLGGDYSVDEYDLYWAYLTIKNRIKRQY